MPNNAATGRGDRHILSKEYVLLFRIKQQESCIAKAKEKGKQRASGSKTSPSTMLEDLKLASSGSSYAPSLAPTPSDSPAAATEPPLTIRIPALATLRPPATPKSPEAAPPHPKTPLFLPSDSPAMSSRTLSPFALSPFLFLPLLRRSALMWSPLPLIRRAALMQSPPLLWMWTPQSPRQLSLQPFQPLPFHMSHTRPRRHLPQHILLVGHAMALMSLFKMTTLPTGLRRWREGWTSWKTGCPRLMSGGVRMRSGRDVSLRL
jgi:hypothetical protein